MRLWKVIAEDGSSCHGGSGVWRPGVWRSVRGPLVPCERGLHLCRDGDLVKWLGPVIWEAEADGEIVEERDKVVVRRARVLRRVDAWNERTARLFAAACAEDALEFADPLQRELLAGVIATVRRHAEGEATDAELAAARSAAWSAAWAASAARSAARSAAAWPASWSAAAWPASESAAWSAASAASAARSAARSAAAWPASAAWERQTPRLLAMLGIVP